MKKSLLVFPSVLTILLLTIPCSCGPDSGRAVSHLQHRDWSPDVRDALNCFMDDCAGMKNAYVVFDFDNTSSIFDVEEQLAIYQLETMSFALDPDQLSEVLVTGWTKGNLATGTQTAGQGKVTAILNSIAPLYGGATPLAGFMDSTGDFNFCTEFSSLRTVVCFNRADRKITDGGGLIAEVAMYEKESLGYDYASARKAGDTFYLLQGRDENGLRSLRSSNKTLRCGSTEERLFANRDNENQLAEMVREKLTVKQAIDRYSSNFLKSYSGYHSK